MFGVGTCGDGNSGLSSVISTVRRFILTFFSTYIKTAPLRLRRLLHRLPPVRLIGEYHCLFVKDVLGHPVKLLNLDRNPSPTKLCVGVPFPRYYNEVRLKKKMYKSFYSIFLQKIAGLGSAQRNPRPPHPRIPSVVDADCVGGVVGGHYIFGGGIVLEGMGG